jgi:hypothetical protein
MATPPLHPKNPERICWGCDKYCPAHDLACGNGTIRTMHPAELFGDDWLEWSNARSAAAPDAPSASPAGLAVESADEQA